jgi:glycosyltransferase involved in cell wall biosynthesis
MPKLVVMLRVKDGALFAGEWLRCFEKLADEIVLLDNGSTDGTYEILKAHPKVVDYTRTEGYNEGRDKNILYTMLRKRNPDWCLWIDIDEIFEPGVTRADLDRLMNRSWVTQYGFRRYHFIDNDHFAGSGQYFFYTSIHDRVMWREAATGYFEDKILDSPNVKGIKGIKMNTSLRLKHLGYISKELVDKKKEIYLDVIESGREASLQKMYLHNEKKLRWNNNRNSWEVRMLNAQLNWMQFKSLFPRGWRKISKILSLPFKAGSVRTA